MLILSIPKEALLLQILWSVSFWQIVSNIQPTELFFVCNMKFRFKFFGSFHCGGIEVHDPWHTVGAKRNWCSTATTKRSLHPRRRMINLRYVTLPSPLRVRHAYIGSDWSRTLSTAAFAMTIDTRKDRRFNLKADCFAKTPSSKWFIVRHFVF